MSIFLLILAVILGAETQPETRRTGPWIAWGIVVVSLVTGGVLLELAERGVLA